MSSQVRLRITGANMVIALAVLLVPLVIVIAACQPDEQSIRPIDASTTYKTARDVAKFPVLSPEGLPRGWRATVASTRPDGNDLTVRVTYFTPADNAMQFVQSDRPVDDLLNDPLAGGTLSGTISVTGKEWQRYRLEAGQAWVLLEPDRTIYLAGDATDTELRAFIAMLR